MTTGNRQQSLIIIILKVSYTVLFSEEFPLKSMNYFSTKNIIPKKARTPSLSWLLFLAVSCLYVALLGLFQLNSVDIYVYILLMWVILFLLIDASLFRMCIWSGVIMIGLNICWYTVVLTIYPSAIQKIWLTNNLKGLSLFNVPIEEHYYIFSLGCVGSIMYKVATGTIKKRPYLKLSKRFNVWSPKSDRLNSNNDAQRSKPYMPNLLEWLKIPPPIAAAAARYWAHGDIWR